MNLTEGKQGSKVQHVKIKNKIEENREVLGFPIQDKIIIDMPEKTIQNSFVIREKWVNDMKIIKDEIGLTLNNICDKALEVFITSYKKTKA